MERTVTANAREGGKAARQDDSLTMRRERWSTGAGDRIGRPDTPQDRLALLVVLAAIVGWIVVAILDGGYDTGRPGSGDGGTGLLVAVTGAALLAAIALLIRPARMTRTAWGGVAAGAGFLIWSALSMRWAPGPDLAWLSTTRVAAAFAALVIGFGVARAVRDPFALFAKALAIAAGVIVTAALLSRVVPTVLGDEIERPRLAWGIGAPNALAFVAVAMFPGVALALASRRKGERAVATAALTIMLTVVALTQSRTGLISLALMVTLVLMLQPHRPRVLAALVASLVSVVPVVVFGYINPTLTHEAYLAAPGDRIGAGLVLGLLVVLAVICAIVLETALRIPMARVDRALFARGRRRRLIIAVGCAAVAVGIGVIAVQERPVGDGANRLASFDPNNRGEWWRQAREAAIDEPVLGHGAGSFPYIHLRERTVDEASLQVRDPHQIVLGTLAELGLVGLLLAVAGVVATGAVVRRLGVRTAPAVAVLAVFLVHSQLDYTWAIPATMMIGLAAAGVILGADHRGDSRRAPAARRRLIGSVALPVIAVVWISATVFWSGQRLVNTAILQGIRGEWSQSVETAVRAADRNPVSVQGLLQEARARVELGDRRGAVRATAEAVKRQPDSPIAWNCRARVTTGAAQQAALAELQRLNPLAREWTVACRPDW